jgi:hypothetical protein
MRHGVGLAILACLFAAAAFALWTRLRERQRRKRAARVGMRIELTGSERD